jgi:hypothetical protein
MGKTIILGASARPAGPRVADRITGDARLLGATRGLPERKRSSSSGSAPLPAPFPGEPAPAARQPTGWCAPRRPVVGRRRGPSRPMRGSTPRRGEARRCSVQTERRRARRHGAPQSPAPSFGARERAPASAGCARGGRTCADARCADVEGTEGDDPGRLARRKTPGGWRLAGRGSLRKPPPCWGGASDRWLVTPGRASRGPRRERRPGARARRRGTAAAPAGRDAGRAGWG